MGETIESTEKNEQSSLITKTGAPSISPSLRNACQYFIRAIILVGLLMATSTHAASWPSVIFPFVFLAYALPATLGALYHMTINRAHKQHKYNPEGKLSNFNRRWLLWLILLFILSLVSAFLFVLEAPSWDSTEWALIWIAIAFYYLVFLFMQYVSEKEYAPRFRKAAAMKWSFIIATAVLCLIYAFLPVQAPIDESTSISDALTNRATSFNDSSCAFLAETDKLTSLADGLISYGYSQTLGLSFIASFIVKIMMFAFVFSGLANQLGACLLTRNEIRSEFQLLSIADNTDGNAMPLRKRYLLAIAGIWLALSALFLATEFETAKMRASTEYTAVDLFVNDAIEKISIPVENEIEAITNALKQQALNEELDEAEQELNEEYGREFDKLKAEQGELLRNQIASYYEKCIERIDTYIHWHNSPESIPTKILGFFGGYDPLEEFKTKVTDRANLEDIKHEYETYLESIRRLARDYATDAQRISDNNANGTEVDTAESTFHHDASILMLEETGKNYQTLNLWIPLSHESDTANAKKVLLNEDGRDEDEFRESIIGLIEQAQNTALTKLEDAEAAYWELRYLQPEILYNSDSSHDG